MFAKAEYDRVLNCLHKIGEHFPKFIQHFTLKIFSIFPKILGEYKAIALQLFLWNAEDVEDLFTQLQPEVLKLLAHR